MLKALLLAMAATHAADAATTCTALARGSFTEANPVFGRASCGKVIAEKAVVLGAGASVALAIRRTHPKLATTIAAIGVTSGGVAFTLNLHTLKGR